MLKGQENSSKLKKSSTQQMSNFICFNFMVRIIVNNCDVNLSFVHLASLHFQKCSALSNPQMS